MNTCMYSVVFGQDWDDIYYFTDFEKAKVKLEVQSRASSIKFYPLLFEWCLSDGVYHRTKNRWIYDNKTNTIMLDV